MDYYEHDGSPTPNVDPLTWVKPTFRGPENPAKGIRRTEGPALAFAWYWDGEDDDIIGYQVGQ